MNQNTIAVAMSGGVDSSVAAYCLQREGYDVQAVFITIRNPSHIPCTSSQDKMDAMRAASALRIPFMEFDATDIYREHIIDELVRSYARGETPNPDVLCNSFVKFGAMRDLLTTKGFTTIATGHYAQVKQVGDEYRLYKSKDTEKDQTYFIYTISSEALAHTLFPIGDYTKEEVRRIATKSGLPSADKKDSTGLCFLGDISMKQFLGEYLTLKKGEVRRLEDDKPIGFHDGSEIYTLGQRHGITLHDSSDGPVFVCKKDVDRNIVWVSNKKPSQSSQARKEYKLNDVVMRRVPDDKEIIYARYRHRGNLHSVVWDEKHSIARFEETQAIASGQSVVFYAEDGECIGGGVVAK